MGRLLSCGCLITVRVELDGTTWQCWYACREDCSAFLAWEEYHKERGEVLTYRET